MRASFSSSHLIFELVVALVCMPFHVYCSERIIESKCTIIIADTNQVYNNFVSQDKPVAYVFYVPRKYIQHSHTTTLRIEASTTQDTSLNYPILLSVRQQRFLSSFEVPFQFDEDRIKGRSNDNIFYTAGRTLCIDTDDDDVVEGRNVTLRVSTQSAKLLSFSVILKLSEDYQLPTDREVEIAVSPTEPKYYGFTFGRPDLSTVKIRAISDSTTCMTISVQTLQCPIYDLEHNVRYKGKWQTMSTTAAMTVLKYGEFVQGFVVVLVAHTNNDVCGRRDVYSLRKNSSNLQNSNTLSTNREDPWSKKIKLIIIDESKISVWIILACLFIPIFVTLLTSLLVIALFRNRHQWLGQITKENFGDGKENASNTLLASPNTTLNSEQNGSANNDVETRPLNRSRVRPSSTIQIASPPPSTSSRLKLKADLYIADFRCKGYSDVKKFAKRFYWTIGIVATFYSIPVYQFVLHYLRVLYRTGEYDICYYNYLCAQRLGVLIDFNHFWSNASYVIFGIFFIFIVHRRSRNLCLNELETGAENDDNCGESSCCCCSLGEVGQACCCTFSRIYFRWDHGVPANFGVFYALGIALTMEGFLSAAYHLCPNQSTFQFDTCFMYVIAVLLLLKIYQFRHPVHFGANHTFAILAGFVIISVLGLLFERGSDSAKLIFKCIFITLQYIVMLFLFVYYYSVGYVRDENHELVTDWRIYWHLGQLKHQRINGDRLILPFITFFICVAVLVYSELSSIGFASYLLYILVGNVLGTTLYYVGIMKPLHGEFKNRTWVQPTLYFIAAVVIGGFSLQYFVRAPAQWELSASASRAENEDCLNSWFPFHPFYDSHDAWHFLSAASLFLAFMGLLIVDDDLITTKQTDIAVF